MNAISHVTFDRLVVPLDGSRLAEVVVVPVTRLATRLSARVILLHVLEDRAPSTVHGDRHLTTAAEADAYLAEIAQGMAAEGVDVEYHSHANPEGDVAASISDHAAELGASLLVLCTHGRGRPRDWIVGSIAQQVVRKAETPVVLIRPPAEETSAFPPHSVVTALDGTPEGERVLPVAAAFARSFGVAHHLLIAVPTLGTLTGDRIAAARLVPSATAATLDLEAEEAGAYVRALADELSASGVQTEAHVARGDIAQSVLDLADAEGPALIAMATHARSGLDGFWSASVGQRVVHRARSPLLLVRAGDEDTART